MSETADDKRAGPGARLRSTRERRGMTPAQVAETLHVDLRIVGAMESDDFSAFDAPVYARGYLRKYASLLDLPPDEVLADFDRLAGPDPPTVVAAAAAAPGRRGGRPGAAAVGVLLLVALAAGLVWLLARRAPAHRVPAAPPVAAPQTSVTAPPSVVPPPPAAQTSEPDPAPVSVADTDAAPPVAPVASAEPTSRRAARANGSAAATAAASTPDAAVGEPGALEVSFAGDCWLEVYGSDGRRLYYDLGHAGERRRVRGYAPWQVFVGNVDNIELTVNGQKIPVAARRRSGATARFHLAADGRVT